MRRPGAAARSMTASTIGKRPNPLRHNGAAQRLRGESELGLEKPNDLVEVRLGPILPSAVDGVKDRLYDVGPIAGERLDAR